MTYNEQRQIASVLAESNTITPSDIFKIVYIMSKRNVDITISVHSKLKRLYVPTLSSCEVLTLVKSYYVLNPPLPILSLSPNSILGVDHITSKHLDKLVDTLINNNDPILMLLTDLVIEASGECENNLASEADNNVE